MPRPVPHRWLTTSSEAGLRLDLFLARQLTLGRQATRRLLEAGGVRVNGRPVTLADKGHLLSAGMSIEFLDAQTQELIPQPELPLSLLAQGPGWLIVDKPPGQPVHPLRSGERGTILNALAARFPNISTIGEGSLRGGVVHRLDVDTSGTLLLATQPETWAAFRQAFQRHETEKIYRALVQGCPPQTGQRQMHLYVAQHRPARVRVVPAGRAALPPGARLCDLSWRVVEQYPSAALVEIRLGTGFLHQIRVMFAELGHPVLGDHLYGLPDQSDLFPRQMLHACRLRVNQAQASSPLPEDFQKAMEIMATNPTEPRA
jgi:23S rRNA pseudouridine1911/1915/1917 synthase